IQTVIETANPTAHLATSAPMRHSSVTTPVRYAAIASADHPSRRRPEANPRRRKAKTDTMTPRADNPAQMGNQVTPSGTGQPLPRLALTPSCPDQRPDARG